MTILRAVATRIAAATWSTAKRLLARKRKTAPSPEQSRPLLHETLPPNPIIIAQPLGAVLYVDASERCVVSLFNPWTQTVTGLEYQDLDTAVTFCTELQRVGGVQYHIRTPNGALPQGDE